MKKIKLVNVAFIRLLMSKIGESLLRGAQEALEHAQGIKSIKTAHRISAKKKKTLLKVQHVRISDNIDVKRIRNELHLSRTEFADRFGFSIRTLEKKGRRN